VASARKNKLYFGDNLTVLRAHIPEESVDLVPRSALQLERHLQRPIPRDERKGVRGADHRVRSYLALGHGKRVRSAYT